MKQNKKTTKKKKEETEVYYFRISKKLLKECKKYEKRIGFKFNDFLAEKAEHFLNLHNINKEIFECIDYCSRCEEPSDCDLNIYPSELNADESTTIRTICQRCSKEITSTAKETLNELELNQLTQIEEIDDWPIKWKDFKSIYLTEPITDYRIVEKGVIIFES